MDSFLIQQAALSVVPIFQVAPTATVQPFVSTAWSAFTKTIVVAVLAPIYEAAWSAATVNLASIVIIPIIFRVERALYVTTH